MHVRAVPSLGTGKVSNKLTEKSKAETLRYVALLCVRTASRELYRCAQGQCAFRVN